MVEFRQKQFTEYDAMRSLYVHLQRNCPWLKIERCNSSSLIPILRGNNVVIERFVLSDYLFSRTKYRMYLKIGAKAKLPDEFRLPTANIEKHAFGSMKIGFNPKFKNYSETEEKLFTNPPKNNQQNKNKQQQKKKKNKNNNNGQNLPIYTNEIQWKNPSDPRGNQNYIDISYEVEELIGDALKYDKRERSLVLEFKDLDAACRALNILPFGINYKLYLYEP